MGVVDGLRPSHSPLGSSHSHSHNPAHTPVPPASSVPKGVSVKGGLFFPSLPALCIYLCLLVRGGHPKDKENPKYQDILQEHAVRLKVTPTALRNILTFKSRTKDTKQFWSPPLWQLYRREHRCAICRGLPDTNRTLCPHYKSGRPRKDGAAGTAGSGVGSAGEKGTEDAPDSARIRSYPIQIAIELVWAAIAGPDTAAVPPA